MDLTKEDLLREIEELKVQLEEYKDIVGAIKNGEIDALAIYKDGKPDIFTLESTDFVYRVLVENFGEGALNISENGLIVYSNSAFEKLTKLSHVSVIGKTLESFVAAQSLSEFKKLFKDAFSGHSAGEIILQINKKTIPVYISFSSLYPRFPGIGVIITNLTQRKKHEKEIIEIQSFLRQLIDSSVEVIIALDTNLKFITVNQKYKDMLHLSEEDITGKYLTDINPKLAGTFQHECLLKALKGEIIHTNAVKGVADPSHYFDTYFIPLVIDKVIKGVIVMSRDVTDIVKSEKELEKKNIELEKKNKELEAFNYIASHDLQEPLRKIQTFTGLIFDKFSNEFSPEIKMYFEKITRSSQRMQNLIKALLNYSRISESELVFETINLNMIFQNVLKELEHQINEQKASVSLTELPVVSGVTIQLEQLFLNLLGNSLKYCHPNIPPKIEVSCDLISDFAIEGKAPKDYWKLKVKDNGIGFEMEYANKIFDVFQRLHSNEFYEGTGIGLAICKKIIENHAGTITVNSKLNEGATFEVLIPKITND